MKKYHNSINATTVAIVGAIMVLLYTFSTPLSWYYYQPYMSTTNIFGLSNTIRLNYDLPKPNTQQDPRSQNTIINNTKIVAALSATDSARKDSRHLVLNASNFIDIRSNSTLQLARFTVSVWFKTSEFFLPGSYHHFIVNKGGLGLEVAGQNLNYGIWMDDRERIQAGFETQSGENHFIVTPDSYNDGKWHNVVLTYDGFVLSLYMDGEKVASKPSTAEPDYSGSQPLSIGVNSLSVNGFFVGSIDDVRILNGSLTEDEIRHQLRTGSIQSSSSMLVLELAFDDIVNEEGNNTDSSIKASRLM